jgi:pilus assembly protein Flp/PilA
MSNEPKEVIESIEQELVVEEEQKERGASMVEYALLVALIAIIAIVAVRTVGQQVSRNFSRIQSELANANS